MTVALIRTGDVTHLAAWIADREQTKARGYTVGSTRPICGSPTAPTYPSTRVRFVWLDDDDPPELRKPCSRCAAVLEQLLNLDIALREAFKDQEAAE